MKIQKAETRLIGWIEDHIWLLAALFATFMGFTLRLSVRRFISSDMETYLLPWYDQIQFMGGIYGLGTQVGDYNLLYQFLIALMTYIPISPVYAYKILSCAFDYLLALAAGALVWQLSGGKKQLGVTAYALVLLTPTVWINSAAWGQCDSLFTFFLVLSFLLLCRDRITLAFVCLGLGFACKLQAVFALPFFLMAWYLKRNFSLVNFLWIPVMLFVSGLPAVVMGRGMLSMFTIYWNQTGSYPYMHVNYPGFWSLVSNQWQYEHLSGAAILLAMTVLVFWAVVIAVKKVKPQGQNLLYILFVMVYTCVLLLPAMHDRYGFPYEILALCILCLDPKTLPLAVSLFVPTLFTYGRYLYGLESSEALFYYMSALNCAVYLCYCRYVYRKISQ